MFDKFPKRIVSFIAATVLTMSNITSVYAENITTATTETTTAATETATEAGTTTEPSTASQDDSDLTHQTFELYPDEESDDKTVTLAGLMPEGAEAVAVDVSDTHEGVAAYDITIKDGGNEFQPDEENPIRVEIDDPVITENITLWHIHDRIFGL